jgi:hypothetical protein
LTVRQSTETSDGGLSGPDLEIQWHNGSSSSDTQTSYSYTDQWSQEGCGSGTLEFTSSKTAYNSGTFTEASDWWVKPEAAVESYRSALVLDPQSPSLHHDLGVVLARCRTKVA